MGNVCSPLEMHFKFNDVTPFAVAVSHTRRLWTPSTLMLTFSRSPRQLSTFYHSMPTPVTKEGVDFSLHSGVHCSYFSIPSAHLSRLTTQHFASNMCSSLVFSCNITYSVKSTSMLGTCFMSTNFCTNSISPSQVSHSGYPLSYQ